MLGFILLLGQQHNSKLVTLYFPQNNFLSLFPFYLTKNRLHNVTKSLAYLRRDAKDSSNLMEIEKYTMYSLPF